jgi:hypothetical protein
MRVRALYVIFLSRIQNHPPSMKSPRHLSWVWMVFLLGACCLFVWNTKARINRLAYLSTIGVVDEDHTANVTGSDAGNTELTRGNSLPIPDQLDASYHWLAQTERMLNRGEARVRHIDYENAPFGRTVLAPSPYRWWLGFLAWVEHLVKGAPPSALVEKAALWADPILLVVFLVGWVILVAKYFGSLSASLASFGLVSLYPFITGFLPGAPDDRGLAQALAMASVLLLSTAAVAAPGNEKARRLWFILGGIAGGLGLWVKVPVQLPVLVGIVGGGLLVSFLTPRGPSPNTAPIPLLPWRAWACAGAATTCVASLIEYSPSELGTCELSFVHPLHGLAWLGAGELLAQASAWRQNRTFSRSPKNLILVSLSIATVAAVPAALLKRHGADVFILDGMGSHLTRFHDGIVSRNLATWMAIQGPSVWLFLTLAPLGLLLPAAWVLTNRQTARSTRAAVAIALGPVLVALAFACTKLNWWQTLDALLLVVLAGVVPGISSKEMAAKARLGWIGIILASLVPGVIFVSGWDRPGKGGALDRTEVQGLILRDLAGWISQHSEPGTVNVLAPPSASTALCYYGAFRGIGSLSEENKDGIVAAVRIMSCRNVREAGEIVSRRKITHIVLLSWDTFFDDSTRAAAGQIEGTFRDQLKFTTLPHWLRPLAYPWPSIPGFEDQSVTVFEVVEEQDEATALGNIALYFLEMGDLDQARSAAAGLTRFSIDFGAWVARAQVAAAVGDHAELARDLKVLQSRLGARVQPLISWNRRVDLAVVLARARVDAPAKKQLELCIADIDEAKIRSLSPGSVYRLLVLCRGLGVTMPPAQRALALSLVPPVLRARLK